MFQKRKEMEIISRALEDLINGKTLEIALPNQDTLPAKVQHQLVRLSDIIRGTQEKAWKERNQIKELIAETAHQLRNPLANMESYCCKRKRLAGKKKKFTLRHFVHQRAESVFSPKVSLKCPDWKTI